MIRELDDITRESWLPMSSSIRIRAGTCWEWVHQAVLVPSCVRVFASPREPDGRRHKKNGALWGAV